MYTYYLEDGTIINLHHVVEISRDIDLADKHDTDRKARIAIRMSPGYIKHVTVQDAKAIREVMDKVPSF